MGKLAVWRLATHSTFGGTWLSDYVPNRLGGFVQIQEQKEPDCVKPDCPLIGTDGNETITADDLAGMYGTIGYEVICGISKRIPRVIYKGDEISDVVEYY